MVDVIGTDEFAAWYLGLSDPDSDAVVRAIHQLEIRGVTLSFPMSSAIRGSRVALRELRVQSGGKPLRVFYAFDARRQAVLLIGGDKTGDKRFYERLIPEAERIWDEYVDRTK